MVLISITSLIAWVTAAPIGKDPLQLTENERAVLADRLIESLAHTPSELEKSWVDEANSRFGCFP